MASHERKKSSEHQFPGDFLEIEISYFMCHVVPRLDPKFLSYPKQNRKKKKLETLDKSFEDNWLCNNMQVNCLSFFPFSFFKEIIK